MSELNADAHTIEFADFERVKLAVGTVLSATANAQARRPAYVLEIDFGRLGVKTSSAQITDRYSAEDLVGRQVVAVMNFHSKRVAGVKSDVLVLAAVCDEGAVLISPEDAVPNGSPIA